MSDLADLAEDITKDLPAQVRKVIDAALANGWELNKPGMTLALRLNHPTDELAEPVYITWQVGRTEKGRLSFKHFSAGTRGLVPLSGADLLEYLADPTTAYPVTEELEAEEAAKAKAKAAKEELPPWDTRKEQMANLNATIGARVLRVERPQGPRRPQRSRSSEPARAASAPPLRASARPLRVQAPKA